MSAWWISSLAFAVPIAVPVIAAARGKSAGRFVAVQLANSLATLLLIALSFAQGQPSFIELPLALALLCLPGTLLLALFLERWL